MKTEVVAELQPVYIRQASSDVLFKTGCCCWHALAPCSCQHPEAVEAGHHLFDKNLLTWKMEDQSEVPHLLDSYLAAFVDPVLAAQIQDCFLETESRPEEFVVRYVVCFRLVKLVHLEVVVVDLDLLFARQAGTSDDSCR
jgi:hypothetical protein